MTARDVVDGWWAGGDVDRADPRWLCPPWAAGCGRVSLVAEWDETEVGCEECGSHVARRCPHCGEAIDAVWADENLLSPIAARALRSWEAGDA